MNRVTVGLISIARAAYSMYIEYGRVQYGVYVDSENYKTIYPYRYNSKYGWCNCTGEYTIDYFKRLLKAGKIILK